MVDDLGCGNAGEKCQNKPFVVELDVENCGEFFVAELFLAAGYDQEREENEHYSDWFHLRKLDENNYAVWLLIRFIGPESNFSTFLGDAKNPNKFCKGLFCQEMTQMNTFGGTDGSGRRIKKAHKPCSLSHLNKAIFLYQLYEVTSRYTFHTNPNKS